MMCLVFLFLFLFFFLFLWAEVEVVVCGHFLRNYFSVTEYFASTCCVFNLGFVFLCSNSETWVMHKKIF